MSVVAFKQDEQDNVLQLAAEIAKRLHELPEDRLWDAGHCGEYFGISKESFLKYKAPLPSFPKPHGPGHPRWFPDEVKEWARANRAV